MKYLNTFSFNMKLLMLILIYAVEGINKLIMFVSNKIAKYTKQRETTTPPPTTKTPATVMSA